MSVKPMDRPRCTPVLPLVYEESLSYYEALCKLRSKLNELITDINDNLQEYIQEYIKEAIPEVVGEVTYIAATETLVIDFEAGGNNNAG